MKTSKILILFILSVFLFSGCQKNSGDWDDSNYLINDVLYPKNAKLKQVSGIESIKSGKVRSVVAEYEYDELGRISKVSQPWYETGNVIGVMSYDIYTYNDNSQLEKIMHYFYNLNAGF